MGKECHPGLPLIRWEMPAAAAWEKPPGSGSINPTSYRSRRTLPVTAVLASERKAPGSSGRPLHWLLLSTDAAPDIQGAQETVSRYEARWSIEEYNKVLKQGTRIEDRRLGGADDLRRCLAFDAVIAWRVFDIQRAAKAEPDRPALDFLHEDGLTALHIGMTECGFTDARPPPFDGYTIREAAIDIGRYVGFIPSKRQPLPGTEKLRTGTNTCSRRPASTGP